MQLKLLRLKRSNIRARQQSIEERSSAVPLTFIEVRKGKDIRAQESCFKKADAFVTVKLLPDGPIFETTRSSLVIPKWYRLFELQQSVSTFTAIEFTVTAEYTDIAQSEVGRCYLKFSELASQETYKAWLPIARHSKFKGYPELEVRVQVITDERSLLRRHMEVCEELEAELQQLLQNETKANTNLVGIA
jgi:hypothetical protein